MSKTFRKAFSLIELSIVILIIGILIAGVTQSSRLIKKFKIRTAQTLTQSSPVAGIKDLILWYETSMDGSIADVEAQDGLSVSTWYDINPQSPVKNNITQATATKQPKYSEGIFNGGIPGLSFDGVNDSFTLTPEMTLPINQTSIVVYKPATAAEIGEILSTTSNNFGRYQIIRYTGTPGRLDTWNGVSYAPTITPSVNPQIVTFTQSGSTVQFFYNGTGLGAATVNNETYNFSQIGELDVNDQNPFAGYIAEVIIFGHTLKTEERQAVEAYLSKKYGIKLN